ncbi:hypothetical protein GCM10011490_25440 [Pseudoclavibacter endophyticus]|nr:hypothetical protein GCM10011490_25440 [Pseudoclavibacter endophyticus]
MPFELEGAGARVAGGHTAIRMRRTLWFATGPQSFGDVLVPGREPGTVRNVLGDAGRVELLLACAVTRQGWFRMRSVASYVRVGRLRVRLPSALGVRADVCNGYDAERACHTVAVRVRNPLLGTVLGYRGAFRFRPVV